MDDYRKYRAGGNTTSNYSQSSRYAPSSSESTAPPTYGASPSRSPAPSYTSNSGGGNYSAASSAKARFNPFEESGGGGRGGGDDEDVEGIKRQIHTVKKDTLDSTRNAVQKLQETESLATNTLTTLGRQGEQLINTERQLDMTNLHADRAAERTDELKRLNRSIFRPSFKNPFTSKKRADKELEQKQREHEDYMQKRSELHTAEYQTQQRINNAMGAPGSRGAQGYQSAQDRFGDESGRYTFEDEDPNVEREIDNNLNIISDSMQRLKMMGTAMNSELSAQNDRLKTIDTKTTTAHSKINLQTNRLDRIK
ncbi:hypothetical protein BDF19DRAFT_466027 [Syncephalis fuscata]|nr:hypothetical protein BDF19DRAFT_466027 [Syncephalis fuscata]